MIAMPGDRSNDDITAFGRLAGSTFDEIVVREDANPRGRQRGEVAELLVGAIATAGRKDGGVEVVLDELEAARQAVARAGRNDLVILMADKPAAVFEQLTGRMG
jgi:cyanophycin synthetase